MKRKPVANAKRGEGNTEHTNTCMQPPITIINLLSINDIHATIINLPDALEKICGD